MYRGLGQAEKTSWWVYGGAAVCGLTLIGILVVLARSKKSGGMSGFGSSRLGPGKFSTGLDQILWTASEGGWEAESAGGVDETGLYYGLLRWDSGAETLKDMKEQFPEEFAVLDAEDKTDIRKSKGAIIAENTQGFVDSELFDSKKELNEKWDEIQEEESALMAGDDW